MTPALHLLRFVTLDIIGEIAYWPVWWYTRGMWEAGKWIGRGLRDEWGILALGPWLRSMFVPMYADYSLAGRAISLAFRILILAWRLFKFFIWTAWYAVGLVLYAGVPVAAVYLLIVFFKN